MVVDYLASLKSLHDVCMAVELVPDWPDYIERFSELFLVLYHHPDLSRNEKKCIILSRTSQTTSGNDILVS